jgi:hypothetical protein
MDAGQSSGDQIPASELDGASSSFQAAALSTRTLGDDEIPRAMIEDTLSRLRGLCSDDDRFRELEKYGRLKEVLANELWEDEVSSSDTKPQTQVGYTSKVKKGVASQSLLHEQASCAAEPLRSSRSRKMKAYDSISENT